MIVAANFKTNLNRAKTAAYVKELESFIQANGVTKDIRIFPPFTALDRFECSFKVGAQNAYPADHGAYTGEIGTEQLDEFGINMILIGHSERRHVIKESQESIAQKYDFFKEKGYEIVYCIGEPLEIRELGNDELLEYLDAQLEGIDLSYEKLVVAYEPVWAIGTGKVPTLSDIELIHNALKGRISKPILYGGSVKPDNTREICAIDSVDGVLVGGASLTVESFGKIITEAKE